VVSRTVDSAGQFVTVGAQEVIVMTSVVEIVVRLAEVEVLEVVGEFEVGVTLSHGTTVM
jgi:hypothetical protein